MEKDEFRNKLNSKYFNAHRIEGIIHMGACSSTGEKDASYLIDNNFNATKELAIYASENAIRFLYASSAATYGDGEKGYIDSVAILDELRPMNMYGYSKHMFDLWAKKHGFLKQITGLKFTNVYGPNERHKADMRSVVIRSYEQIKASGTVELFKSYKPDYKDGEQKRDFIYVKDAVRMLLFLLGKSEACGLFNIGSGKAETWNSLVEAAFKALDKKASIEYIDMPPALIDRYQYYTCASMDRMRDIGYTAGTSSLEDAIFDYVVNYMEKDRYLGDE